MKISKRSARYMNKIFGTKHIILILISFALIIILSKLSEKISFSKLCKIMLYVGIASETVKIFYYIITNEEKYGGILPKTDLPFHLCSIQILFILVLNLTENERIRHVLLSFMYPSCLIGGIAAIFIATSSSLNGLFPITAQYFLYHISIVVFAIYISRSKDLNVVTTHGYASCLKFLIAVFFFAVYINSIVYDGSGNINFMYVVSPPQSGLPFLNKDHGWFVYIIHYASLVLFCVTGCYARPIISSIKNKIKRTQS